MIWNLSLEAKGAATAAGNVEAKTLVGAITKFCARVGVDPVDLLSVEISQVTHDRQLALGRATVVGVADYS